MCFEESLILKDIKKTYKPCLPKNTPFLEEYFETKHELSLKNIAHTHHLNYHCAKNEKEAEQIIPTVLKSNQFEIVEFFTGNVENEKILNDYFSVIKK